MAATNMKTDSSANALRAVKVGINQLYRYARDKASTNDDALMVMAGIQMLAGDIDLAEKTDVITAKELNKFIKGARHLAVRTAKI